MKRVLIIDDEVSICSSLESALEDDYEVFTATDGRQALGILARGRVEIVLLDVRLGQDDGLELLRVIKGRFKDSEVIIMTAYGSVGTIVEAVKAGAYYYFTKPINIEELKVLVLKACQYQELNAQVNYLDREAKQQYGMGTMIGDSPVLKRVKTCIERIKDIDCNVLVTGESGTGKELVVKAIHYEGNRSKNHLEIVNCAAIPQSLLESELFGYEKGAYTGAHSRKVGKFELADGGTIFLDEIGDMDAALQAKLLRVLEEKAVTPLGATIPKKIDVRIIAATNKDLEQEVAQGRFREDLFYRLNVVQIKLPSLRERKEDLILLIRHFIEKYSSAFKKKVTGIDENALSLLESYDFKGNVRELKNIIERAVALCADETIRGVDLPAVPRIDSPPPPERSDGGKRYVFETLAQVEEKTIRATLAACGGNKKRAAALLGISERGLFYKLKDYRL